MSHTSNPELLPAVVGIGPKHINIVDDMVARVVTMLNEKYVVKSHKIEESGYTPSITEELKLDVNGITVYIAIHTPKEK